jgi:two-component system LytT family response regulator
VQTAIELRQPARPAGQPAAEPALDAARPDAARPDAAYAARLLFRDTGRTLGVDVDEIDWVEAAGNYVQIYTARRVHLVRHTVKAMVTKLDPCRFVRVRPSAIVNADAVARIVHRPGGEYLVTLRDGTQIPTSRGFRAEVERVLLR